MIYILFAALVALHVLAFVAYLLGGSLDRALISLVLVFGAIMFLNDLRKKDI
jgi:hypothetical protein